MAKEIELKLSFPKSALDLILAHPLIAQTTRQNDPETLETTYFDTPDLALHQERIALRTRKTRAGLLQTVKCAAESVGGLSSRPEWEQPYDGQFDFAEVEIKSVRNFLEARASKVRPIFATVFHRDTRLAEPKPGCSFLIMIDTGKVVSGKREGPICELELELQQGSALDLQDFAIQLAASLPLIPYDTSKAERGYNLFHKEVPKPQRAGKSPVLRSMNTETAFRALAAQGLQCWQANLHGALASSDPEFVHQFRVALRRLGTLLKVFKPVLAEDFIATWSDALKELARLTGEARDLDVMRATILQPMLAAADSSEHKKLMRLALATCKKMRAEADTALDHQLDGVQLLRFSRDINARTGDGAAQEIVPFAEKQLKRLHRKAVKRFADVVKTPTSINAHRLRISFKHLRYACEFFARLFDEQAMQQYAKEVSGLQDELGDINDLHVALTRLDDWASRDSGLGKAHQYLASSQHGRIDRKLEKALISGQTLLAGCQPWCGECDRRGMDRLGKRLRHGVSLDLG